MKPIDTSSVMAMRKVIISQNDALQKAVAAKPAEVQSAQPAFGTAMTTALNQVNDLQHSAGEVTRAYTTGETTDIAAVMLAKQKASLGFEATLQVRNKLLNAYQDIMKMPV